jgi:hypothetical protein
LDEAIIYVIAKNTKRIIKVWNHFKCTLIKFQRDEDCSDNGISLHEYCNAGTLTENRVKPFFFKFTLSICKVPVTRKEAPRSQVQQVVYTDSKRKQCRLIGLIVLSPVPNRLELSEF